MWKHSDLQSKSGSMSRPWKQKWRQAGESPGNCGQLYLQNLTGRGVCGHGVPTVLWVLTYKDGSFIYTAASERKRRAWGKFWGWELCSLTGLWWGRHQCRHMPKLIRLHVWNTCSRFYIDHASKNNARSQMTASDYGWTPAVHKQKEIRAVVRREARLPVISTARWREG